MNKSLFKDQRSPLLIIGLISFLLFLPYLLRPQNLIWPNSGFGADITHMFWPAAERFAEQIRYGQLVLWDPMVALGRSVPGDIGTLWLYPLNLIFVFVDTALGFTLLAILHTFIAGTGMYLLAQRLMGSTRHGALVSALAFMLSPKVIAHLAGGHLGLVYGLAWLPFILLFAELAYQKKQLWFAVPAGLLATLLFPTHPQIMLITIYILLGRFGRLVFQTVQQDGFSQTTWEIVRSVFKIGAIVAFVSLLIGAVWWLPILEILPHTRSIEFESTLFWYQIPAGMMLTLLSPPNFQFPEWTIYIGTVPLLLALIRPAQEHRRIWYLLWLGIILVLLFSLGDATPIYEIARNLVPGLAFFRARTRLWFLGLFILALLAGRGADRVFSDGFRKQISQQAKKFNLLFAGYFLLNFLAVIGLSLIFQEFALDTLRAGLAGLAVFIVLWLWRKASISKTRLKVVIIAALIFDLGWMATEFMRPINPQGSFLQENQITRYLNEEVKDTERIYVSDGSLSYALLENMEIESLNGLLNLQLSGASQIINTATGCIVTNYTAAVPPCISIENSQDEIPMPSPKILGMLNVGYIISPVELSVEGLELVYEDLNYRVYKNQFVLPRAFLATQSDLRESDNTLVDVVLADLEQLKDKQGQVTDHSPDHFAISVNSPNEAILVYSTAWAPGWQVTVNGEVQDTLRVNDALLGVSLSPGTSDVVFEYDPMGWQIGWRISSAMLFILGIFATITYLRNWRKS